MLPAFSSLIIDFSVANYDNARVFGFDITRLLGVLPKLLVTNSSTMRDSLFFWFSKEKSF